jgi:type VI secretion system secreted protein VgrG
LLTAMYRLQFSLSWCASLTALLAACTVTVSAKELRNPILESSALLAFILQQQYSSDSGAKSPPSPIEYCAGSYVFDSVGKPTSALSSGCAGSVDENNGPVRRYAARPRGMGFGSVHGDSEAPTSASGQANCAAQWGIRTQEWGSSTGYNQLVFDDNDTAVGGNQQRIHLKTSQYASELSLGHLVHAADNHRGSLRGQGFELRTDAYGALRAGSGLHLSTYRIQHSASAREPAGENVGAVALLKQARLLSETFSQAAGTHSSVQLAVHQGSIGTAQSALDGQAAPLAALYKMAATQVSSQGLETAQSDARQRDTAPAADKLPHSGSGNEGGMLSLAGQGGIAVVAGQSLQLSNSETTSLMSGQDSQSITGGQLRIHTGQAIGMLAGAVDKGEDGKGLTLIAGKDPVRYEAQSNEIKIQAKQLVNIQSANAHIDWAAAKKISLSTAGGANITIEGGNITVQCPGKLTVHAASKTFEGPTQMNYQLPIMPRNVCIECLAKRAAQRSAFVNKGA